MKLEIHENCYEFHLAFKKSIAGLNGLYRGYHEFTKRDRLSSILRQAYGSFGRALEVATEDDQTEVIRMLLEYRANDKAPDGSFCSALETASRKGRTGIVRMLLESGADIHAVGSALQAASTHGRIEIVRLLLQNGSDFKKVGWRYGNSVLPAAALQAATERGHAEVVKMLLERGANVNTADGWGDSPLLVASALGRIDIVRLLLAKGANVNSSGGIYRSALQAARGHTEVFQLLYECGAKWE
ncbi:putative serine/threonine-protein kinase ripk4 [Mycena pura]|uniref:Serine/threonine-protein kinase ripk4 n=1 Tax=Mycena pura TaxID=153505 RepID=A0AAD6YIS3_9AGAR|nr:putative serine/threonine-protein kinase ripk4 [Mycena pura]